jgi:outer membrane biosynthesis protein TonB
MARKIAGDLNALNSMVSNVTTRLEQNSPEKSQPQEESQKTEIEPKKEEFVSAQSSVATPEEVVAEPKVEVKQEPVIEKVDSSTKVEEEKTIEEEKPSQLKEAKKPAERKKKKKSSVMIGGADFDEKRVREFKRVAIMRPIEMMENNGTFKSMLLPESVYEPIRRLAQCNKSITATTIVSNLILDFVKEYEDIIGKMEEEYSKNKE